LISPLISHALERGAGLDGKTALQELVAERNMGVPEYVVTDSGPDHDKDFVAEVRVHGKAVGRGAGKSKREAEQSAAKLAHEHLSSRLNKK